jgi:hypothetical protein
MLRLNYFKIQTLDPKKNDFENDSKNRIELVNITISLL